MIEWELVTVASTWLKREYSAVHDLLERSTTMTCFCLLVSFANTIMEQNSFLYDLWRRRSYNYYSTITTSVSLAKYTMHDTFKLFKVLTVADFSSETAEFETSKLQSSIFHCNNVYGIIASPHENTVTQFRLRSTSVPLCDSYSFK